jgi:hypothetical protein
VEAVDLASATAAFQGHLVALDPLGEGLDEHVGEGLPNNAYLHFPVRLARLENNERSTLSSKLSRAMSTKASVVTDGPDSVVTLALEIGRVEGSESYGSIDAAWVTPTQFLMPNLRQGKHKHPMPSLPTFAFDQASLNPLEGATLFSLSRSLSLSLSLSLATCLSLRLYMHV